MWVLYVIGVVILLYLLDRLHKHIVWTAGEEAINLNSEDLSNRTTQEWKDIFKEGASK